MNGDSMTFNVIGGPLSHFGGDRTLAEDFLNLIKTGKRGQTDLIFGNGLSSALSGVASIESVRTESVIGKKAFTLIKGQPPYKAK